MLVLARDKQLRRYAFFESNLFETHVQHFMCDSGLHYVCGLGDTQVVEAMIDCGAEINALVMCLLSLSLRNSSCIRIRTATRRCISLQGICMSKLYQSS